ncbi:hypothetical protein ACBI99_44560 [Nonomuraea sp. ATR24]|uniref:hypothetical protein n=1 Tax=unclassified Nonomuraea TaxID=2593643 RepID=UPI0033CF4F31
MPGAGYDRPVSDGAAPLFTRIMHDRPYAGGIRRTWLLQGDRCAIQVTFAHVPIPLVSGSKLGWEAIIFGYHSQAPQSPGEQPHTNDCPYVEGGVCHFEGTEARAAWLMVQWVAANYDDDVIWAAAERAYRELFVEPIDFVEWMVREVGDIRPDTL